MSRWVLALAIMLVYLGIAFLFGMLAGRGRSAWSVSEFAVANRELGLLLMWFLMGGTVFSAFAFLGGPGWAYSRGVAALYILSYGVLGILPWYFLGPRAAALGRSHGYVTQAQLVTGRFPSRLLSVLFALLTIAAFVPYIMLQMSGAGIVFNAVTA